MVVVRVVVRLGSVVHRAVRNAAPLPWLGGLHPCCSHLMLDAYVSPARVRGCGRATNGLLTEVSTGVQWVC